MMKKIFLVLLLCLISNLSTAGIPGDFDLSGIVDVNDLHLFSQQWLGSPATISADIAPNPIDGFVDFLDFDEFSSHWLATLPDSNEIAFISGGQFFMGDSLGDSHEPDPNLSDELPVHLVELDAFYIGKYEVTNAQYCDFLNAAYESSEIFVSDSNIVYGYGNNNDIRYCYTATMSSSPINFDEGEFSVNIKGSRDMSDDPVILVTWYGAAAYCNWRSKQEGYQICYDVSDPNWTCDFNQKGYHLPTESQWEYAARGGLEGNRFPWNDPNISHGYANYKSTPGNPDYDISETSGYHPTWSQSGLKPYTAPVGSFSENGYGLYDLAGNAFEWCNDWYDKNYYDNNNSISNPTGPDLGQWRVIRGGSFELNAAYCRTANRDFYPPQWLREDISFRICLNLE